MRLNRATRRARQRETQLNTIRDLMVGAATRGVWVTLQEIAVRTEFAEASISAQLRHLRKKRHGNYCVEKRPRRQVRPDRVAGCAVCQGVVWEYRVILPQGTAQAESEVVSTSCGSNAPEPGRDTCQSA